MKVFIYKIYFPESGKCYVGQTDNIKRRMMQHLNGAKSRTNSLVHRALLKYDDWEVVNLHTCQSRDEANCAEIEEVRNFNSVSPNGYNLNSGGAANKPSEETRRKVSESIKRFRAPLRKQSVINTVGKSFNMLYVVGHIPELSTSHRTYYQCICDCGNKVITRGSSLRSGSTKSCGCWQRTQTVSNMVGETFGRVHIVRYLPEVSKNKYASKSKDVYLGRCICGVEREFDGYSLRSGGTKSCGCLQREVVAKQGRANRGIVRGKFSEEHIARRSLSRRRNHAKKLELQDMYVMSNASQLSLSDFEDLVV